MNINVRRDNSKVSLMTLEGEMTIYSANEIKKSLTENLGNCSGLNIDLSMINKIDTAGFQLLLLARIESETRDIQFEILNPSQDVENIFEIFGESH